MKKIWQGLFRLTRGERHSYGLPSADLEKRMLERRQILIKQPIDDECANRSIAQLLFLNQCDNSSPITLFIDSPGGSLTASLAIFDTILWVQAPVHTWVIGSANGTALWLLAAGKPGSRFVVKDSVLTMEAIQVTGQTCEVAMVWKMNDAMARNMASCSRMSESEVLGYLQSHGRVFTSDEAIACGIADCVSDLPPGPI